MKKVYWVIKVNQKAWLKPYISMNPDLRKAAKMILKKDYFKLINNSNFGKNMENFGKQ